MHVPTWVEQGAPLGIEVPIPTCGIFPRADDDKAEAKLQEKELEDAGSQLACGGVSNYMSVANDPENALAEVERYGRKGT